MGNPLMAFFFGSLSLGTYWGIRVRVHAWMIILIVLTLLLDSGSSYRFEDRLTSMGLLLGLVLMHEFGHCFMARRLGGDASDIVAWPLGGLVPAEPPRRPGAVFMTAVAGPLVNAAVCLLAAVGLHFAGHIAAPWTPFHPLPPETLTWRTGSFYLWWTFVVSYVLLLFNLLPMFPMDGGQMLQAAMWRKLGYHRAMHAACIMGMTVGVAVALGALPGLNWFMLAVGISGFITCYQQRMVLKSMGPEETGEGLGYGELEEPESPRRRRISRRSIRRARKLIRREEAEQAKIDLILGKVSAKGMTSLTWWERRTLRKATEHQRQRDLELTRNPRT